VLGPYCGDGTCNNVLQFLLKGILVTNINVFEAYYNISLQNVFAGNATFRINGVPTGNVALGQSKTAAGLDLYLINMTDEPDTANVYLKENVIVCDPDC
jgi:hypothetical protein